MDGKLLCFIFLLSVPNQFYAEVVEQLEANCNTDSTRRLEVYYGLPSQRDSRIDIVCDRQYELTTITRSHQPQVQDTQANEGTYYTLIMADPDAPSPRSPTKRYWLHWLVTNIEGDALKMGHVFSPGKKKPPVPVTRYEGPSPPRGSGSHRYYFYLFEQSQYLENMKANSLSERGNFDVAKFVEEELGIPPTPVALNMFRTERVA